MHKQRYLCKHCNKAFTLSTSITNYSCFISNNTKHKIARDLVKKRSEKDIASDNNVSPNTVERIMDSYYETQKVYKHYLPKVLLFNEFNSSKWKRFTCFKNLMTTTDVLDLLIDLDNELKETYWVYQDLLHAFKKNNFDFFK